MFSRSEFQQFKWSHDKQQKATAVWMLAKSFASTSGKVKNAIKNCMIVESRSGVSGCPTKMRYVSVENMWKHKHETLGVVSSLLVQLMMKSFYPPEISSWHHCCCRPMCCWPNGENCQFLTIRKTTPWSREWSTHLCLADFGICSSTLVWWLYPCIMWGGLKKRKWHRLWQKVHFPTIYAQSFQSLYWMLVLS